MSKHIPILKDTIVEAITAPFLRTTHPCWLIDATLGGGGHLKGFLQKLQGSAHRILALDQDRYACEKARQVFQSEIQEGRLKIVESRFSELKKYVQGKYVLGFFADLGFSSDQIEDPKRGLSFLRDGPLDMRLSHFALQTCYTFLKQTCLEELKHILFEYGQERFAGKIAKAIISARQQNQLPQTTVELATLIQKALMGTRGKLHPATKTFQALRIYLNQELLELELLLNDLPQILSSHAVAGFLSFHSLEDRKVKHSFQSSHYIRINKKVICPSHEEQKQNPRSRSAKLRLAIRQEQKE